ncbi:MAG: hypothetical protein RSC35_07200 [Mucinivorans sp.]
MCNIVYTYRRADQPLTARERLATKAEKRSDELKMARYLMLLAAHMKPKKRLSTPREHPSTPPPKKFTEPDFMAEKPLPVATNLLSNSSFTPRRLAAGSTALAFRSPLVDKPSRGVQLSLCLTSEARGYIEFRPITSSSRAATPPPSPSHEAPPSTIRLHYQAGKNNLRYLLGVMPLGVDGFRLYLPPEFGAKTVWCETACCVPFD